MAYHQHVIGREIAWLTIGGSTSNLASNRLRVVQSKRVIITDRKNVIWGSSRVRHNHRRDGELDNVPFMVVLFVVFNSVYKLLDFTILKAYSVVGNTKTNGSLAWHEWTSLN